MPVYARSDVSHVAISLTHGGCGQAHSRPVYRGAPAQVWELRCPQCEDYLRSDPLWAPMPGQVPETPDEKVSRESSEKRSQLQLERSNAEAFSQLANAVSGNSNAMHKLVELMAMMNSSAIEEKATVQGEVLSRARALEKEKAMGEPLWPATAPAEEPVAPPVPEPEPEPVRVPAPPPPPPPPPPAPPAPKPVPKPEVKPEPKPEPEEEEEEVSAPVARRRGRPKSVNVSGN